MSITLADLLADGGPTPLDGATPPREHAEEGVSLNPVGLGKEDVRVELRGIVCLLEEELAHVGGVDLVHVPERIVVVLFGLELMGSALLR